MAAFILIPGAGGQAWYWHLVAPELDRLGHRGIAVELPSGDDAAGLSEYADAVVSAVSDLPGELSRPLVAVAQSMAGFTAPLVCQRLPVDLVVLVNAMIPTSGESGGQWWGNTGHEEAQRAMAERDGRPTDGDFDPLVMFFHDVTPEVTEQAMAQGEIEQSDTPFQQPLPYDGWPDVPTRVLTAHDDRLFPLEFQRRIAEDRLGITPDEMPGGHLVALSQPTELTRRLVAYADEL